MVNPLVERATSDMLVGPDWSMNIGICDLCNRDAGQARDVVKGIKKRLGSKNVKVQLLALTLLETIVKNCGDFVHKHVAERDLLRDMVKIVKKKPDFRVKEKILVLIDTWQEAFGGARARYPQYYAAYNELLHLGTLFPKRTERLPPVYTPLQTQPLMRNPENGNDAVESSTDAEISNLSMTEIHNARSIIDVLAEMLIAVDPTMKEGLRQEVVVDLVQQCRTYKKRVVHLVNSTSDESLLCEGLALNDELQIVLDKHEALVSGASAPLEKLRGMAKHEALVSGVPVPSEKMKPKTSQLALVPVDAPLIDTRERQNPGSTVGDGEETRFLAPTPTSGPSATSGKVNPMFDLLSGDEFSTPTAENFLAIVPLGEPQPATLVSQQNMMSQNSKPQNLAQEQTYSSSTECQHFSSKQPSCNLNGSLPQYEPMSQNTQGSIPAAGQTYSASPKYKESQQFPSQQPSFQPNGSIHNAITPQYEPMPCTQVSSPEARQRFSSLPQLEQSEHFPSHQSSFSPKGSVSLIIQPQYEPRSPYAQGSSPTAEKTYCSSPQFQHFLTQPPSFNPNGSLTSMVPLQCEPTSPYSQESNPGWNVPQQQQPSSPIYGAQTMHGGLPPPPWEAQPEDSNQLGGMHYPTLGNNNNQPIGMYMQQQITAGNSPTMSHQAIHPQQHITGGSPPPMSHQAIHPQQHITGGSPTPMSHQTIHSQQQTGGTPLPMSHQAIRPQQHITGNPPSPMSHKAAIHPAQQQITGCPPLPMNHKAIHQAQQKITGCPPSPMIHQAIHLEQIPQQQFQGQHTMGVLPHYHMAYMYPQQIYGDPMAQAYGYGGGYRYSYGYTQPQHAQLLDHRMSWLSVRDDGFLNSSTVYTNPSTSNVSDGHMPSLNPSKPEDKLFQDLLDLTNKTTGKK